MSKAFTLIEVMVVVAIIGIFSVLALASMSGSKSKGSDASVQQVLKSIQNQSELHYLNNGNAYGAGVSCITGMFNSDTTIRAQLVALQRTNGNVAPTCRSSTSAYAVSSPLVSNSAKYWCIDSTGFSGIRDNNITTSKCPAS